MKYSKEIVDKICMYLAQGDTQKEAGKKAGICEDTFAEWVKNKPGFSERVKEAKEIFKDNIIGKLETSLWKVALGYEVEESKTTFGRDADGNPIIVKQEKTKKNYAPNVTALIFALSNLAPDRWKNRQQMEMLQREKEEESSRTCFDNIPKATLFRIADELQDALAESEEKEREKLEKMKRDVDVGN